MKKLVSAGLAIALLFGGATFSSATIAQPASEEKHIQAVSDGDTVDAQWAAMARLGLSKAGEAIGKFVGKQITCALIGNSDIENPTYQYEEVKESFDLN